MAAELDGFYQGAGRESPRQEPRAGAVGAAGERRFLAAGVAHEINNPLNIISGYAELTLKRLRALLGRRPRRRRRRRVAAGSFATRRSAVRRSPRSCCRSPAAAATAASRSAGRRRAATCAHDPRAEELPRPPGDARVRRAEPLDVVANANGDEAGAAEPDDQRAGGGARRTGEVRIERAAGRDDWVELSRRRQRPRHVAGDARSTSSSRSSPTARRRRAGHRLGCRSPTRSSRATAGDPRRERGPGRGSRFTVHMPAGGTPAAEGRAAVSPEEVRA